MNICFCIPARFESTRLKNKLLLDLNGESCIRRTVKQVLKSFKASNIMGVSLKKLPKSGEATFTVYNLGEIVVS